MKTRLIGKLIVYKKGGSPSEWWFSCPICIDYKDVKNPILSKETRTKIAILDLMNERGELPCRSKKIEYMKFTSYLIFGPILKYRQARRMGDGI